MNPLAYLEGHRNAALATAAAGVGGLALYRRHKATAAGTATTTGATSAATTGTVTGSSTPVGSGTYDNSSIDGYNGLEDQITALGTQLQGLTPTSSATSSGSSAYDYSTELQAAVGGYYTAPGQNMVVPAASGNGLYYDLQNQQQAQAVVAAGQHTFWQPSQGVFTDATTSPAPAGAALFEKVG